MSNKKITQLPVNRKINDPRVRLSRRIEKYFQNKL